jgi:hypothetical protein
VGGHDGAPPLAEEVLAQAEGHRDVERAAELAGEVEDVRLDGVERDAVRAVERPRLLQGERSLVEERDLRAATGVEEPVQSAARADLDRPQALESAELLPNSRGVTYYIHTRPEPQLGHDLIGAGLLFFLPAVPVPSPREAQWVLSYDAPTRLPKGVRAERAYTVGKGIYLIRVRQA